MTSLGRNLFVRQVNIEVHETVGGCWPMWNSFEWSTFKFYRICDFNLNFFLHFWWFWNFYNCSQTKFMMKSVDRIIYFFQSFDLMSNISINWPLSQSCFINKLWNIICRFPSTKSSSNPFSSSNQLEWSCCNLFSRLSDANNTRFTKSSMSSFESFSHYIDISSTIISKVYAPFFLF